MRSDKRTLGLCRQKKTNKPGTEHQNRNKKAQNGNGNERTKTYLFRLCCTFALQNEEVG